MKSKINQYEYDLNIKENELKTKEDLINKTISDIKTALGLKHDQDITVLNNSVIKFKNSEKVFGD